MTIRQIEDSDWAATWRIIERFVRAGETYAYPTDILEEVAQRVWVEVPLATFVAVDDDNKIVGTYYLKANHPGPGSHICNGGYIVSDEARGQGVASAMCEHSQREAVDRGFRAMQAGKLHYEDTTKEALMNGFTLSLIFSLLFVGSSIAR